jgi:hypothetical protein
VRLTLFPCFFPRTANWDEIEGGSGATKQVTRTERGWAVDLRVPWSAFGLSAPPPAGDTWRVNVGRYNAVSSQQLRPNGTIEGACENSSSAPLTEGGFHRYEEFNTLVFGPPIGPEAAGSAGFVPDTPSLTASRL